MISHHLAGMNLSAGSWMQKSSRHAKSVSIESAKSFLKGSVARVVGRGAHIVGHTRFCRMVILFQKLESAAIAIVVLVVYHLLAYSWLWFFLLILVPDIFMLGYVRNPRMGAIVYNIGHSYFFPIGLWGAGYVLELSFMFTLSLI